MSKGQEVCPRCGGVRTPDHVHPTTLPCLAGCPGYGTRQGPLDLNAQVDALHGPGAAAALDDAYGDGSVWTPPTGPDDDPARYTSG